MSTPTIVNSGTIFNNGNGSIVVTLPGTHQLIANTTALANTVPSVLKDLVVLPGKTRFRDLTDVVTVDEKDGDTVIYDQQTDTYNVETMDGGEF